MIRANPIGRFYRAVTFAQDRSIWRQLKGEVPPRRAMGTGRKILLALGAWMGLGAMAGMYSAQQSIEQYQARPKIAVEPIVESENIIRLNVRGLDRDIANSNVRMGLEKGCGAKMLGKRMVDEMVQFRVDLSGMVSSCDVRLMVDGQPFTYKNAFTR
ncbi:hypothetical protein HZC35_03495 [Candidatus Saganbacteria bacterium]|nr:hypothetical protein [Candidatus Saganbacteria bacterium]